MRAMIRLLAAVLVTCLALASVRGHATILGISLPVLTWTEASVSAQTTNANYPASVAQMFPGSTAQAWAALLKVADTYDLKIDTRVNDGGLLITNPVPLERRKFGFHAGDIARNLRNGHVRLHVFVPPFIEPARVYVGSTMVAELAANSGGSAAGMLVYNVDRIGAWLFDRLSEEMKMRGQLVPQDPARRAALAKALWPSGDHTCLSRIEQGNQPTTNQALPRPLHREEPVFTRGADRIQKLAVTVRSVVGEDGFAWPIGVTGGPTTDDFATTTLGAAALWRFAPRLVDGCPAPTPAVVTQMSFIVR
jgi:hypothetical protein